MKFEGNLEDKDDLRKWISEKCTPFVREITFANAEVFKTLIM